MISDAKTIQCAAEAGLVLCGENEDHEPEYIGDRKAFKRFNELMLWVESCGSYPWVFPF